MLRLYVYKGAGGGGRRLPGISPFFFPLTACRWEDETFRLAPQWRARHSLKRGLCRAPLT